MPDKKLTDVTDNKVGKMTDSEILKALEETIEYNNRIGRPTAIMDIYSLELFLELIKHQNEQLQANSDSRQTNEFENIDVARFEAEINRLQAENKNLQERNVILKGLVDTQKAENERLKENLNIELEKFATEYDNKIKAEAYKEFAERLKGNYIGITTYYDLKNDIDNLLKELVGEDSE